MSTLSFHILHFDISNFRNCLYLVVPVHVQQLNIKKNAAAREAALKEQKELPKAIYVPLPVWKETKERIRLQMDVTRRSFHDKSREWEQKERVRLPV